jgi:hypothetical protein
MDTRSRRVRAERASLARLVRSARLGAAVALVPALSYLAAGAEPNDGVSELTIDEPRTHWTSDFIALVPAIHPPTTHDREDLIQVWLKLPAGGRIGVRHLPEQDRYTLTYPPGTVADRVEYYYLGDDTPDLVDYAPFAPEDAESQQWTVADVRGTRLVDDDQHFHVYRPVDGDPHAKLVGWSWQRGDDDAQQLATELLAAHSGQTDAPLEDEPLSEGAVESLRRLNDCASCHVPDRPRIRTGETDRAVERATDALGFIVPNAVLRDECVVVHHRPEDLNAEDPFVEVRCDDGQPAVLRTGGGSEWYVCEDGSAPRGYRDVAAGLAAGHSYTLAVCQSRQALHERMTPAARQAFRAAFEVCGI